MTTRTHLREGSPCFPSRLKPGRLVSRILFCSFTLGWSVALAQYPATPQIFKDGTAIALQDYASLPLSTRTVGTYPPVMNYQDQLSRLNFLRVEPTNAPLSASRLFVNDLNRNLYILDRTSKAFTIYINFEVVFPKFVNNPGFAGGLVTFAFDPDYANNHKFYTVHTEDPTKSGSAQPTNSGLPGLNLTGYAVTAAVNPPAGTVSRESVLIEWTDTNITNATFEGTARELLRIGAYDIIHPIGDLMFNPLAQPGGADYQNLYLAVGDGGAGEVAGATHTTPQRLDALPGKILRITPDTTLRPADALSPNGRYRIPSTGADPNPFVLLSLPNLRKEIYAYGFRNVHRMSWDPVSNKLIVAHIGLHSWEVLNVIHEGANYGWAEREGTEQIIVGGANDGLTGSQTTPVTPFPSIDMLTVTGLASPVTPLYPVAEYSHRDGDAIANGFVYRGTLIPQLAGKYIFGDISTARLFYCNLADLISADDGIRTSVAPIHEIQVVYNGVNRRMFDMVANQYRAKGGTATAALPNGAAATSRNDPYGVAYGGGRADLRLAQDNDGEMYVLTKSDGMIRKITALLSPPTIQSVTFTNSTVTIGWPSIINQHYRLQFKTSLTVANWTNVTGDVTATTTNSSKSDTLGGTARFYRVILLP